MNDQRPPGDRGSLRDWVAWHDKYGGPASDLSRRLVVVQRWIAWALGSGATTVVSACAGDGRDLLGVLGGRSNVRGRLVELDPVLAARARAAPPGIEVVEGDAGSTDAFAGAVPADLVLLCGIFGNVVEDDIRATVAAAPMLCAPGATVIWTRGANEPDLRQSIRRWFTEAGFDEIAFEGAPEPYGVGVCRLVGDPPPFEPGRRLFSFVV